jgi:hypothetical protein
MNGATASLPSPKPARLGQYLPRAQQSFRVGIDIHGDTPVSLSMLGQDGERLIAVRVIEPEEVGGEVDRVDFPGAPSDWRDGLNKAPFRRKVRRGKCVAESIADLSSIAGLTARTQPSDLEVLNRPGGEQQRVGSYLKGVAHTEIAGPTPEQHSVDVEVQRWPVRHVLAYPLVK